MSKYYAVRLTIHEIDQETGLVVKNLVSMESPKLPLANAQKLFEVATESVKDYEQFKVRKANERPRDAQGHFLTNPKKKEL